jgi:hypothetical protein
MEVIEIEETNFGLIKSRFIRSFSVNIRVIRGKNINPLTV